mmetsp:Transcript_120924/g.342015  ORF Transcript_120924/g.342015 Transcript_120924/m.342015 type:complete len:481 (+) Transcript_120924:492-1934(+)
MLPYGGAKAVGATCVAPAFVVICERHAAVVASGPHLCVFAKKGDDEDEARTALCPDKAMEGPTDASLGVASFATWFAALDVPISASTLSRGLRTNPKAGVEGVSAKDRKRGGGDPAPRNTPLGRCTRCTSTTAPWPKGAILPRPGSAFDRTSAASGVSRPFADASVSKMTKACFSFGASAPPQVSSLLRVTWPCTAGPGRCPPSWSAWSSSLSLNLCSSPSSASSGPSSTASSPECGLNVLGLLPLSGDNRGVGINGLGKFDGTLAQSGVVGSSIVVPTRISSLPSVKTPPNSMPTKDLDREESNVVDPMASTLPCSEAIITSGANASWAHSEVRLSVLRGSASAMLPISVGRQAAPARSARVSMVRCIRASLTGDWCHGPPPTRDCIGRKPMTVFSCDEACDWISRKGLRDSVGAGPTRLPRAPGLHFPSESKEESRAREGAASPAPTTRAALVPGSGDGGASSSSSATCHVEVSDEAG